MEVHKHPHHVTHSKKWFEYLLEFLMLFLAVYLGFVAENLRESSAENKHAKEYAEALIEDLKKDTASIKVHTNFRDSLYRNSDSLMYLLARDSIISHNYKAAIYFDRINTRGVMVSHRGTIQQLESSGALRYFRNKNFVSALVDYYDLLDEINHRIETLFTYERETLQPFRISHFDYRYKDSLINKAIIPFRNVGLDEQVSLYSICTTYKGLNKRLSSTILPQALKQAELLIALLQKEYHLEN